MQEGKTDSRIEKYATLLKDGNIQIYEYEQETDLLRLYTPELLIAEIREDYLKTVQKNQKLKGEDLERFFQFCTQWSEGMIELVVYEGENMMRVAVKKIPMEEKETGRRYLLGWVRDDTKLLKKELEFENRAVRDSMTQLYNHAYGQSLINEYLKNKNPYSSCGMMVIDVDFFKNVNDSYGHLFGDKVLIAFSKLLSGMFRGNDIVMRAGGDEFVVFLKDISHNALVKRSMELVKAVQNIRFTEYDYVPTCSVGVCYLPENVSGYTYDQVFKNADWALYRAKEKGRNRYMFCDNLLHFEDTEMEDQDHYPDIEARYFQNDMIATAFEIFEKTVSVDAAIRLLLRIIGIRYQLDRITIVRTNVREKTAGRQYQWCSPQAPPVLEVEGAFTKEDFLTLFQSYDEYGVTVLDYDHMEQYSKAAEELLMQGEAKTVVYAAMYTEGHYTGAISYVVCKKKRLWTKEKRRELGEVTKIIAAYLAKRHRMNERKLKSVFQNEYDHLTGLLSFSKFREEIEYIIVGGYAKSHIVVYSDFENFKYYNQKYGYAKGDDLLKEFVSYIIGTMKDTEDVYFARVVADQFVLFMPYEGKEESMCGVVQYLNDQFLRQQNIKMPEARLRIRTGIYRVTEECTSASQAIDAANFARKQVKKFSDQSVILYNEEMGKQQIFDDEVVDKMDAALREGQFSVYLQPKFSLITGEILGAEALIRWNRENGEMVMPDRFIPLYEENGQILELDYYVIEQVASFLAEMKRKDRKLYPISVNVSILHTLDESTVGKYQEILDYYGVDSSMIEIELTESATVDNYEKVKQLFTKFQEAGFKTAMDDFGAGYSVLNMVIDIPVNTVKLDRFFISNCENSEKGIFFLKQIVGMIRNMGYQVLCEGVETKEQAKLLRESGCEIGQGFLTSKAIPMEEFEKMLYGGY